MIKAFFIISLILGVTPLEARLYRAQVVDSVFPTLPKIVIGKENAPVQVVMYVSPTCYHCARYKKEILPSIKENYVDKGIVSFEVRINPMNYLDLPASKIAWGEGPEKFLKNLDLFFSHQADFVNPTMDNTAEQRQQDLDDFLKDQSMKAQKTLVFFLSPEDRLLYLKLFCLRQGFSVQMLKNALYDTKVEYAILAVAAEEKNAKGESLNIAPAFYVNGKMIDGILTEKILKKYIDSSKKSIREEGGGTAPLEPGNAP